MCWFGRHAVVIQLLVLLFHFCHGLVLGMTYTTLYRLGPRCLKNHLLYYEPAWLLRLLGEELLRVLSTATARLMATENRAFSVVVPQFWNSLPRKACLVLLLHSVGGYNYLKMLHIQHLHEYSDCYINLSVH